MTCPSCQTEVPEGARFCPSCGTRLDTGDTQAVELPATEPARTPVTYVHAEPRLYGVVPPGPAFLLSGGLAVGAVVLLALGSWVLAVLVLVIALLLFLPALAAARHAPDSVVARNVVAATDAARGWVGFVGGSAGAWSAAGRDVLRLRTEIGRLRPERDDAQFALGDAAFREDAAATASLRAHLRDLDREITSREQAIGEALQRARRKSRRERRAIQATERVEAIKSDSGDTAGKDV
jgi:zinc ribbon protein